MAHGMCRILKHDQIRAPKTVQTMLKSAFLLLDMGMVSGGKCLPGRPVS